MKVTTRTPVWKRTALRPQQRWQILVKLLERKNKAITILSALVVVASFVAKEGLDSHFETAARKLESAEGQVMEEARQYFDARTMNDIKRIAENLQGVLVYRSKDPNSVQFDAEVEQLSYLTNGGQQDLRYASLLANAINEEPRYAARISELQSRIDSLEKQFADAAHRPMESREHSDFQRKAEQIDVAIADLRQEALSELRAIRKRNERNHLLCIAASYVLFGTGWALGLLSSLVPKAKAA